jgi:cellulose biosynthesis protein BcsQ
MSRIVTLYNHKGGVSKTTTTFNVAHDLARSGVKTLVIDADPQCNMTELLMFKTIEQYDEQGIEDLPGKSLLDLLRPRISGETATIEIKPEDLVPITDNLSVLRGDVNLSTVEDALAEAHIQRFSTKIHEKRTYVALADALRRLAASQGFQAILIDVGPSSGALTRTCFLSCDGFLVPTMPDRFNVQAIQTLSAIVDRWMSEHSQIVNDFKELSLPISPGRPKFLGGIIQGFKLYKGKPKKSFAYWMNKLPERFDTKLLEVLKQHSSATDDLTHGLSGHTIISNIPYFESLAPMMQATGKPVFAITQGDTAIIDGGPWQGSVWQDATSRMALYEAQLKIISAAIMSL